MYSGLGGANGADFVAQFLMHGYEALGAEVRAVGRFGGYEWVQDCELEGLDFVVHSSGWNLTPELVGRIREHTRLVLWTHNDEMPLWQGRVAPVSELVDLHYSYTQAQPYGEHVRYLPLAADERLFHPHWPEGYREDMKLWDVAMIGAARQYRVEFCEKIGKAFPNSYFHFRMGLRFQEINDVYNRTRVVIAPVQDCDEDVPGRAWGCPCRTFEVPAARAMQLQVLRGGLRVVYPYAMAMRPEVDAERWIEEIAWWIEHEGERATQAEGDFQETRNRHLYRHRAQTIAEGVKETTAAQEAEEREC
jgi:hypothetical protein